MAFGARAYRIVFALVGWFAIGLQYWLMLTGETGKGAAELTLNFFSYFTILMNVIVALAMTGPALAPDSALGRWTATEGVRAAVAMYIAVVGVTYHFLLSHVWDPQGWLFVSNGLLHYVMPIAFVLDWLLFTPKGGLRWIDAVKWLSVPLVYMVWTVIHGYASDWWPYWFVNLPTLGLSKAAFWFTAMLALFMVAGLVVVAIDRTIGRRDRSRASA
ncbi:MAG: hypothetical protein EOP62_19275 [Sphingomonadales bacterium]|nr:MAG: hypothetical protein EOP62_19275 [Sphingomonadales bacterium]